MRLASAVRRHLMELEEELERRAAEQKEIENLKAGDVKEIYLHARRDSQSLWDSTSKELVGVGIEVRIALPASQAAARRCC